MTASELAGTLATIAAAQDHTTAAVDALTNEVKSARLESQEQRLAVNAALGRISTEVETTKLGLSNHIAHADQRIETIWRVLKWFVAIAATGGTVAGGARIAGGFL